MLIGDKGGNTTKIAVVPILSDGNNNSTRNCTILGIWDGNDDRNSLEKARPLFDELSSMKVKWYFLFFD